MPDNSEFAKKINSWKLVKDHSNSTDCHHQRPDGEETVAAKLAREAYLLQSSLVQGVNEGFNEAKEDPVGTAARIGTAVVSGFVLAKVTGASRCLQELSTAANVGLTTSALFDLAQTDKLARIGDALSDAWTSSHNLSKDKEVLTNELGRFAYDSVLSTLAASLGTTSASIMRTRREMQCAYKPPRATLETGSVKLGNKRVQMNHLDAGVTIHEGQYAGRWVDRTVTYKDWLEVREHRCGALEITVPGEPHRYFEPPALTGFERLKSQTRLLNFGSPLPSRPHVTEVFGGGHAIEFAGGAKLHVGDPTDIAILKNGKETFSFYREPSAPESAIDYFKRSTLERPEPE